MAVRRPAVDGEDGATVALRPAEARKAFDQAARRWLDASGEKFVSAWDAGDYGPDQTGAPR